VVDIRQCIAVPVPLVIKPKIVHCWSERRVQMQSDVNQTELTSELNLQSNYFTLVKTALSFEEQLTWGILLTWIDYFVTCGNHKRKRVLVKSGLTISYLLYDAIHGKNQISQEEPAQSSPKIKFYSYS